jgi:ectoine hydroxylase-related dioxygenase (phytanoyl-CoA dioxygenase family)
MFTAHERETFAARGLIKRTNFLAPEKLQSARHVILRHFEREGIWRDGGWQFANHSATTMPDSGMSLVKALRRQQAIIDLTAGEALAAARALVDGQLASQDDATPGLLFTLPNASAWAVPHQNWHQDFPRFPGSGCPGVQIFAFLDKVAAGGGGTLVVAGSHRLLNLGVRMSSSDLRKQLKREAYFAELMSNKPGDRMRFMREPVHVDGVEQQVVELTGDAGDVYFMDLRVLHTFAPNSLTVPRLMLTHRYLLESARVALDYQ